VQRALSAPGKLFLCGEYAVLWGGTARIAAVGPRTEGFVRRRADRQVHLVLEQGRLVGQATPVGVNWGGEVPEGFSFAARTVDEALRVHGREALGFELLLAPSPGAPDGRKLGLGGSARSCVLAAEACRFVLDETFDALKLALLAHGKAQQLQGSGGDVAAIFAGGVVRYRRYDLQPLVAASGSGALGATLAQSAPVELWRLPSPRVYLSYAFAQKSASTRVLISEVERSLGAEGRKRFVDASDSLGERLERGLLEGRFEWVAEAAQELEALLGGLGPLETEPMRQIIALARTTGSVAKLSGAGGGDGCIVFSSDETTRLATLDALRARGFHAFALTVEPGIRGEASLGEPLSGWLRV
jgi:phosphomevalonate kinase